jgi:FtsZ-interacting cell division protein ZipA
VAELLEFVFANLFVVVLVIGGIISFMKRLRDSGKQDAGQQDTSKKTSREQNSEKRYQRPERNSERPDKRKQRKERDVVPQPVQELKETITSAQEKIGEIGDHDPIKKDERVPTRTLRRERPKQEQPKIEVGSVSPRNAVEGIIWSEILGPPRSRKPHPSVSGNRTSQYSRIIR